MTRADFSKFKKETDIVAAGIADIAVANDARIARALRTLLAEPGNPHSGAAAALADLDDFSGVQAAAQSTLDDLEG